VNPKESRAPGKGQFDQSPREGLIPNPKGSLGEQVRKVMRFFHQLIASMGHTNVSVTHENGQHPRAQA